MPSSSAASAAAFVSSFFFQLASADLAALTLSLDVAEDLPFLSPACRRSTTWMTVGSARRPSRLRRHPGRPRARSGRRGRPRGRRRDRRTAQGQRRYAKRPAPTPLPRTEIRPRPAYASVTTNRSQTRQSRGPNVAPTGRRARHRRRRQNAPSGTPRTPEAAPASRDVARAENKGWSLYGAQWAQPVATGGKSQRRETAEASQEPLPWVATGCGRKPMVRRGSPVRVRKRALQKSRKSALFVWRELARSPACSAYGALYGAFRFRAHAPKRRKWTHSPEGCLGASASTASSSTASASSRRTSMPGYSSWTSPRT
jgi:hypothetical protein